MQPIASLHMLCIYCKEFIYEKSHCDRKFHTACRKKFYNDINNAARSLKKKIHAQFERSHGERSAALFTIFERNDKVLRKVIHCYDFGFLPVPKDVLTCWGYNLDRYSHTEINPTTDGRIFWTYALGVEMTSDPASVIIRFRDSAGRLRHIG